MQILSGASKYTCTCEEKHVLILGANVTCFGAKHSKSGVGGCCRLDLFLLNKIVLDVKNNFCGSKCPVSEQEICL